MIGYGILIGSILIVAYFLGRLMNMKQVELNREYERITKEINKKSTTVDTSDFATQQQIKKLSERIDTTWQTINSINSAVESIKLLVTLRK